MARELIVRVFPIVVKERLYVLLVPFEVQATVERLYTICSVELWPATRAPRFSQLEPILPYAVIVVSALF